MNEAHWWHQWVFFFILLCVIFFQFISFKIWLNFPQALIEIDYLEPNEHLGLRVAPSYTDLLSSMGSATQPYLPRAHIISLWWAPTLWAVTSVGNQHFTADIVNKHRAEQQTTSQNHKKLPNLVILATILAGANSGLCGQHLHSSLYTVVEVDPQRGSILHVNGSIVVKAQGQQEGSHNPHKGNSQKTQLRCTKRLCHWVPQYTYYLKPPYQELEWYSHI